MSDGFDPLDTATDPDTKYRFFPYVRRGYPPNAHPDLTREQESVDTAGQIGVDLTVDASGDGSAQGTGSVSIDMYGPGHVTGIDERQVVRVEPEPDTSNFPPNYFATVEFDAPDLPWLFSPAAADTQAENPSDPTGRGLPWLCLVVVEKSSGTPVEPAGTRPLPSMPEVPVPQLPPLDESWAWAHAQLVGSPKAKDDAPTEQSERDLEAAFGSESNLTRSRLVSPRNLRPDTTYVAAVVPVFEPGRKSGLGQEVATDATTMDFAWSPSGTSVRGGGGGTVTLPVYHHWEFSTGATGDFEYLARELEPRNLNASAEYDIGFRDVDATDPGPAELDLSHLDADGEGPQPTVRVGGAIRQAESTAGSYAAEADLRGVLNEPEKLQELTDEPYDVVGPPVYGDRHAQVAELPGTPAVGDEWLHSLNLHPGHRLAAAVGTGIVRDKQEQLMASAWDQVGEVRKANRALAAAQLSRAAMETGLRALEGAPTGWAAQFTAPAHDRVLLPDGAGTAGAHLDGSTLPRGLSSAPFRRLLSGSGRLAGRLDGDAAADGLLEAVATGEASVADPDRAPAGTGRLAPALDLLRECERAVGGDFEDGWRDPPREDAVQDLLDVVETIEARCSEILEDLADVAVALERRHGGGEQPDVVLKRLSEVASAWDYVAGAVGQARQSRLWVAMADLEYAERTRDLPRVVDAYTDEWGAVYDRINDVLDRHPPHRPVEGDRYGPEALRRGRATVFAMIAALEDLRAYLRGWTGTDDAYEAGVYCDPDPSTPDRHQPDLGAVVDAVRPIPSLVGRVSARIGGVDLSARDRPLDRIMAYPEFPDPMYRDLKSVSEEYLLPGAAEIPRETFGALETNPQFIESFMVGLNHEMADELLWRGYPCTRRGSYFRQFWDPSARVPKPDDPEDLKDITEIHAWDDKGGASPLGSNVMTGAGGGGNQDAGQTASVTSNVVVVVRGELLRRYPRTIIYATKAKRVSREGASGTARVPEWPTADETDDEVDTQFHRFPIFRGELDPDVNFLGFDLGTEAATGEEAGPSLGDASDDWVTDGEDEEGWFFVMEEPPGEVKFGIDVNQGDVGDRPNGIRYTATDEDGNETTEVEQTSQPSDDPEHGWSGLSWGHLVGAGGDPASLDNASVWNGPPHQESWRTVGGDRWVVPADELPADETEPSEPKLEDEEAAVWGRNSAHMAYITWQRPVRIAIHADDLLPGGKGS